MCDVPNETRHLYELEPETAEIVKIRERGETGD